MASSNNTFSDVPTRVEPYPLKPAHGRIYNTLDWLGFDVDEPAKLTKNLSNRSADILEARRLFDKGEINAAELGLRTGGAVVGGVADAFAGTVDMVTPDRITEPLGDAIGSGVLWGMDKTGATEYMQNNPRHGTNIMAGMEVLGGLPALKALRYMDGKEVRHESTHGGFLSGPSNYIPNYYGIDNKFEPNSLLEEYMFRGVTGANMAFRENPNNPIVKTLEAAANVTGKAFDKVPILRIGSSMGRSMLNALNFKGGTEGLSLARKIVGFGTWGMKEGMASLLTLSQPSARALWKEQGINQHGQKLISKHMQDALIEAKEKSIEQGKKVHVTQTRAFEKAVAQSIYMRYVGEQAGRGGKYNDAYKQVFDKSTFGGILENTEAEYLRAIKAMDNTTANKVGVTAKGANKYGPTTKVNVPEEVNSLAYQHMSRIWKIPPTQARPQIGRETRDTSFLVVKKPRGSGGDHQSSVYHSKFNTQLEQAHKWATAQKLKAANGATPEPLTDVDLYLALTRKINKKGKSVNAYSEHGLSVLSKDLADVEANGLWLQQSGSGRAIVEGGINRLTKYSADGNIISYISDQMNFLENMPVLGDFLNKTLNVNEITMTPPITHNVLKSVNRNKKSGTISEGGNNVTSRDMEKLAEAKASASGIAGEVGTNVVNTGLGGILTSQMSSEPETQAFNYNNRFNNLQI